MERKKTIYVIFGMLVLFSIILLKFFFGYSFNQFTNSLTSENLSFTENQNITRYLEISRYANVTSAYLNLSGSRYEFIDQSETSYSSYLGNVYDKSQNFIPQNDTIIKVDVMLYSNANTLNFTMTIKNSAGSVIAGPEYLAGNLLGDWYTFNFSETSLTSGNIYTIYISANESLTWSWARNATDTWLYKEYAYNYPNNPYVQINNTQIWNHTGEFNSTYSPNKTTDFATTLNNVINGTGSGNCPKGTLNTSTNNCTISFIFHSDSSGNLQYSDLNVTWTSMCDYSGSGNWIITEGRQCTLSTSVNLDTNTFRVMNGSLRISETGSLNAKGCYVQGGSSLYVHNGGKLMCRNI